jgi:hypothetical protein
LAFGEGAILLIGVDDLEASSKWKFVDVDVVCAFECPECKLRYLSYAFSSGY